MFLRAGYQKQASLSLSPSFDGNYDGKPQVVYKGSYSVPQAANVGNTINVTPVRGYGCNTWGGCNSPNHNDPLWLYTGFQAWPEFTTYFDWSRGDASVQNDRIFLWDMSVDEGDTWQQLRCWFGMSYPCSGVLLGGFPNRRVYGVYEGEELTPRRTSPWEP